jgi:hypothetical protein
VGSYINCRGKFNFKNLSLNCFNSRSLSVILFTCFKKRMASDIRNQQSVITTPFLPMPLLY